MSSNFSFMQLLQENKIYLLIFIASLISCSSFPLELKQNFNTYKISVLQPDVKIEIKKLKSITSIKDGEFDTASERQNAMFEHALWMKENLEEKLIADRCKIVPTTESDFVIKLSILDLAEIRTELIIKSIAFGIMSGLAVAYLTGFKELGLGVLLFEVVEESAYPLIALYLLNEYVTIANVKMELLDKEGNLLYDEEFSAFWDFEFEKNLPENLKKERAWIVRASLAKVNKNIAGTLTDNLIPIRDSDK